MLRFIDRLNGIENGDEVARNIKNEIKMLRKQPNSLQNRKKIKRLYEELDEIQYKPDYMCLIIDKEKDYWRACKGFKINGVAYARLLGTNGGIKNSTIVFVSERLAPELRRLIDNGRDKSKELVPAKLEAYQALVCSGSIPVSIPHGIAVVDDCVTHFKSDVVNIEDADGEPKMWFEEGADVELDESDGYGIMLPSLARRWSEELKLDYMVSGVNTRLSFEKGIDDIDSKDVLAFEVTKPNKMFNVFNGKGVFRFIMGESNLTDNDNTQLRIADYYSWKPRTDRITPDTKIEATFEEIAAAAVEKDKATQEEIERNGVWL